MLQQPYSKLRKYLPKYIRKIFENEKKPMGRWNNEKSTTQIKTAIDLANVDHCGPCGTDKIDNRKKNTN